MKFKKDITLKGVISPKISEKEIDRLNTQGLEILFALAEKILQFSNEAPKQESKEGKWQEM